MTPLIVALLIIALLVGGVGLVAKGLAWLIVIGVMCGLTHPTSE